MEDYSELLTMEGCRLDRLDLEEKKITAAHNAYMFHMKKHYDDGGWHNLRAFLINRVEQATRYRLIVTWSHDEANPEYKILDRKTYLKETYNIDWKGANA